MVTGYREISKIIYSLKREWGMPVQVCRTILDNRNLLTGKISRETKKYSIKRAIALPKSSFYTEVKSSILPVNGADTVVIVDNKDLPKDFKFKNNDYLVIKLIKYEIVDFESIGDGRACLLNAKTTGVLEEN